MTDYKFRSYISLTYSLTGNDQSLESINVENLPDGDGSVVLTDDGVYFYKLNNSSGQTPDELNIIKPLINAGTKRWILKSFIKNKNNGDQNLSDKQDALISGSNIRTVNGTSLLGSGNIASQASLVSGTNIRTVNGTSLLGSGNIAISSGLSAWVVNGTASGAATIGGNNGVMETGQYIDMHTASTSSNYTIRLTATDASLAISGAPVVGSLESMSMSQSNSTYGSFACRATGTGDSNLAGLTFHNNSYAIKLGVRHDGYVGLGGYSRAAWSWYSDSSGNMVAAGNVTAYSDPRLKENFERIEKPFDILNNIDGGTFNWKYGFTHTEGKAGKRDYGILSDQVETVMPEIITESIKIDGESYKTVSYEKLIPVLLEAVKQLEKRISELEGK